MLECETWYDLAGQRQNLQRFTLPREEVSSLRRAVNALRRRNPVFHIRLRRIEAQERAARSPMPTTLANVA